MYNFADQDTEGWETVQRGGRLKHKSNSRSSLHKDSLTQSSESVHKSRHSSNSSEPFRKNSNKEEPMSPEVILNGTISQYSEQPRNRTSSRDSEKENMPLKSVELVSAEVGPKRTCSSPVQSPTTPAKSSSSKQHKRWNIVTYLKPMVWIVRKLLSSQLKMFTHQFISCGIQKFNIFTKVCWIF